MPPGSGSAGRPASSPRPRQTRSWHRSSRHPSGSWIDDALHDDVLQRHLGKKLAVAFQRRGGIPAVLARDIAAEQIEMRDVVAAIATDPGARELLEIGELLLPHEHVAP